jgi:hypothetical protein
MSAIRALGVAALVALDASVAGAQSTRHFDNSWFWGGKVGILTYQVQSEQTASNPSGRAYALMGGGDWLITRKKGGLYVAFDHSFFQRDSVFVNDSVSPLDTVPRTVTLTDMRRFTLAGMLFPLDNDWIHPYAGFGVALSSIADARAQGTFRNNTQQNLVLATIAQFKTVASPIVILGTQLRLLWISPFAQVTASPAHNNFFLFTETNWRATLEVGARYNIGSSIDRMR